MKVILLDRVKGHGEKGDVVDVSAGYARNYLFPRNLAVEANAANMKELEKQKKAQKQQEEEELAKAKELAAKIEKTTVEIKAKSGEAGRLFGSVTSKDIADVMNKKHGIKIDRRKIVLPDPIRELGVKNLEIRVHPGVVAKLKVHVIEE
ncbi:MAG: 50S ribosomal protein L9 [Clostridiales bacterium]|nr:50S ribosomal protein L9 [Clostridiales bacterium]